MKTIPVYTDSLIDIPECWLYKNNQLTYMVNSCPGLELPRIDARHEDILSTLDIPYEVVTVHGKSYCDFWDADNDYEVELTLPLYIYNTNNGCYRFAKRHTDYIFSKEAILAANELAETVVLPLIREREEEEAREMREAELKEAEARIRASERRMLADLISILNKAPALGINSEEIFGVKELYDTLDLNSDGISFKVFPVYCLVSDDRRAKMLQRSDEYFMDFDEDAFKIATDYVAIFDTSAIKPGSVLELRVPKGTEGMFVGRNGWQIKKWSKELGVRRIIVISKK